MCISQKIVEESRHSLYMLLFQFIILFPGNTKLLTNRAGDIHALHHIEIDKNVSRN